MATTAISRKYACLLFILVLHEESVKFVTASSNVKNILPPSSISLSPPRTPPRFTHVFQSDQILQPNTRLSLKCEATGHPLPQITWTLDGQSIVEHSRLRVGDYVTATGFVNSFVNISSLRVEDGGVYTCTASNGDHSVIRHTSRINVYGPPLVKEMKNMTAISGERVQIDCPWSGFPIESIAWEKGSSSVPSSRTRLPQNHRQLVFPNGTLVIKKIERGMDEDEYRCIVFTSSSPSTLPKSSNLSTSSGQISSQSSFFLRVVIPPLLSPISLSPNLREGMRTMLTCSVLEGDPPFSFRWTRSGVSGAADGEPVDILPSSRIRISSSNDFSSTLTINHVTFEDNGNITCTVESLSPLGSTLEPSSSSSKWIERRISSNYTLHMVVKVPPKWILPPSDMEVVEGTDVTINCQATGFPQPRIWWEHSTTTSSSLSSSSSSAQHSPSSSSSSTSGHPTHYQPVISNSHIHALENGSLIIREVRRKDEGFYLCQATNGVGSGMSKVIKITVRVPPSFRSSQSTITVKKGERDVVLNCEPRGEKPMTISWTRDGAAFDPLSEGHRYEVRHREPSGNGAIGTTTFVDLKIKMVERRDSTLLTCIATNNFGRAEYSINLIVQEPPDCPPNVKATEVDSRSLSLVWSHPFTGNSPITDYVVEYQEDRPLISSVSNDPSAHSRIYKELLDGKSTTHTIRRLHPATSYLIRIYARNALGVSGVFSQSILQSAGQSTGLCPPLIVKTEQEAPSSPPREVKAVGQSSTSLLVTWKYPFDLSTVTPAEGVVTGYYVGYRVHGAGETFSYKTIDQIPLPTDGQQPPVRSEESCLLAGLTRHTRYEIVVQAFNSKGAGPPSHPVEALTLEFDVPVAPVFQITGRTANSLSTSWKVDDTSNPISGFLLFHKTETSSQSPAGGDWEEIPLPAKASEYNLTGLSCGKRYHLYLLAWNDVGRGPPSEIVSAKTDGAAPIAPSAREVIQSNSTFVVVNLSAWKGSGCPIQHFVVQYKPRSQREFILLSNRVLPEVGNLIISDLPPAKWYTLFLTATNEAGSTEAEYSFSTLTLNGDIIPAYPLESLNDVFAYQVKVMMPVACFIVVITLLIAVWCVMKKKKTLHGLPPGLSYQGGCDSMKRCTGLPLNEYESKSRINLHVMASECGHEDNSRTLDNRERSIDTIELEGGGVYFPSPYASSCVVSVNELNETATQAIQLNGMSFKVADHRTMTESPSTSARFVVSRDHYHGGRVGCGQSSFLNGKTDNRTADYDVPFKQQQQQQATYCHLLSSNGRGQVTNT